MPPPTASEAELAEDRFFAALVDGDVEALAALLTEDFLIVDVLSGGVADRATLLGAFRDGLLAFERVDVVERVARRYGDTVVIVGRTEMAGSFGGAGFTTASRYTHVIVRTPDGTWRLASAQGTQIAEP